MKNIILVSFLLLVLFGCSSVKPTIQEKTFLGMIHECFAEPDYVLLEKRKAVEFLQGNTEHTETIFEYHDKSYVLDAERAWVTFFWENKIDVPIERAKCGQNKFCFKVGEDRQFIKPWFSSCESMRENFIRIQDIEIGQ